MNCIFRRWTPAQISLKSHLNLICINRQQSPELEATPAGTHPEGAIGYHSKSIANQLGIDSQNIPGKTFSFRMYVHVRTQRK